MVVMEKGGIKDEAKVTSRGEEKTGGENNENSEPSGGTVWGGQ